MTEPADTAGLLTVEQAAQRLGTGVRFIRRLVAERRIRFHKVGKYVRFDPADLTDYIHQARVEPIRPVLTYTKGESRYAA
ncbi:excisionase family DNA-binding protein [Micromonospora aurantiaca (nom. illeg.)]|uniref:excisionase family DNA-binding protein n=1 Tax=Micromonospora aurantiaca (nom. illeg.) TaxID=47850 RepID=UPI0026A676A6